MRFAIFLSHMTPDLKNPERKKEKLVKFVESNQQGALQSISAKLRQAVSESRKVEKSLFTRGRRARPAFCEETAGSLPSFKNMKSSSNTKDEQKSFFSGISIERLLSRPFFLQGYYKTQAALIRKERKELEPCVECSGIKFHYAGCAAVN